MLQWVLKKTLHSVLLNCKAKVLSGGFRARTLLFLVFVLYCSFGQHIHVIVRDSLTYEMHRTYYKVSLWDFSNNSLGGIVQSSGTEIGQEKTQSERNSHSKAEVGKKTNLTLRYLHVENIVYEYYLLL